MQASFIGFTGTPFEKTDANTLAVFGDYISIYVIRAARAHTDEIGCVLEADIYRTDFDFTGVERLKHRPALKRFWNEHQRCANKPAQGNALGTAFKNGKALKGRQKLSRPFRALLMMDELPRALPWAGLLPGLWP